MVTNDLGGPDQLSESQRQIIRRIASMSVWCESQEAKMADGDEINIDQFQRTANSHAVLGADGIRPKLDATFMADFSSC